MTHKRIRRFNTKDTYPEQKLDNDLCQVVVAKGSMVFVRGQVGQDLDTAVNVAIGDAAGQTEQAMTNVKTLLAEAGAELGDICKITIYITDPRYREAVYRKIGEYLKGVFPVSTGIVVSALAPGPVVVGALGALGAALAAALDAGILPPSLPHHRRQVNELWLDRYRGRGSGTANFLMLFSFVLPEIIVGIAMFLVITYLLKFVLLGTTAQIHSSWLLLLPLLLPG